MTDLRVKYSLDSRNYANLLQMWQDVELFDESINVFIRALKTKPDAEVDAGLCESYAILSSTTHKIGSFLKEEVQ